MYYTGTEQLQGTILLLPGTVHVLNCCQVMYCVLPGTVNTKLLPGTKLYFIGNLLLPDTVLWIARYWNLARYYTVDCQVLNCCQVLYCRLSGTVQVLNCCQVTVLKVTRRVWRRTRASPRPRRRRWPAVGRLGPSAGPHHWGTIILKKLEKHKETLKKIKNLKKSQKITFLPELSSPAQSWEKLKKKKLSKFLKILKIFFNRKKCYSLSFLNWGD